MNEQSEPAEIRDRGSEPACPLLDSQLAELIEVVWACEVAARRETASTRPLGTGAAEPGVSAREESR
jgi:hypothetical protein